MEIKKDRIWIFLDCEGPFVKNDNAAELTEELAEKCGLGREIGRNFYKFISKIDDAWGDFHQIAKDPAYSSGHTLKVVLPFFKAMGATEKWLYDFSKASLLVVPEVGKVLRHLQETYGAWIISTSYNFFVLAFCDAVGFNFDRVVCTEVKNFDKILISPEESKLLKSFMKQVAGMSPFEYDEKTGEPLPEHKENYEFVTNFIWEVVYNLEVGEFLRVVHPVGQTQKMEAVQYVCRGASIPKEKAFYVGDSQTDVQVVEWLRGEGLSMMFNGKGRVCGVADVMYIGESAEAIEEVAYVFARSGRQGVANYCSMDHKALDGGTLKAVTQENWKELERQSVDSRKKFRGVHIGELT